MDVKEKKGISSDSFRNLMQDEVINFSNRMSKSHSQSEISIN